MKLCIALTGIVPKQSLMDQHSGDMSRVFKKDFDIFFRKKGNFNRPSAENPKANISSC